MATFALYCCKLDSIPVFNLFQCQRHAAQAPFWPKDKCIVVPEKPKAPLPTPPNSIGPKAQIRRPENLSQQGQMLEKALLAAAAAVLEHAQELDDWDQR